MIVKRRTHSPLAVCCQLSLGILIASMAVDRSVAQTGVPAADPTQAAQSYDARQLELQRVREAAQRARAEAQRAAMARSAERALEEQHIQGNVQDSLEIKRLKAQAAEAARRQTASNAYQPVSSGDMQGWQGGDPDAPIQRGVPQQFTDTVASGEGDEDGSGGFGGMVRGILSWRPSIPFVGGDDEDKPKKSNPNVEPLPQFTPAGQLGLDAVPPPVETPSDREKDGFRIPLIGGLFGGDDDQPEVAPPPAPAPVYTAPTSPPPAPAPAPTTASYVPAAGDDDEEAERKRGLLSRLNPFSSDDAAAEAGDPATAPYYADAASLPGLPTAADSSESQEASAGLFGPVGAPTTEGGVVIAEDDEDKPGFFGRLFGGGDDDDAPAPARADSDAGGIFVVDSDGAQLLKFGNATVSSDALPLRAGTVVRVTKSGDEWSSIQLASGVEGIIRNKSLRPASASEGTPAMFAHLDQPRYPTTARINQTRSANSASSQPVVPIPTPELPSASAPSTEAPPIGNGLLPPLPATAIE